MAAKRTTQNRRAATAKAVASDPLSEQMRKEPLEALVPHHRLIAALVNEAARARVRHRALLDVLEERGLIEIARYLERYQEVEREDFVPFCDLLLLSSQEFAAKHSAWLSKSSKRFGYDGSSRTSLVLSGVPQVASETTSIPRTRKVPLKQLSTRKRK